MTFTIYVIGLVIALAGLIYGAHLLHIAMRWIVVGAVTLFGLGILAGVTATRHKDPNPPA